MRIQISSGQGQAECEYAVGLFYRQLQTEIEDIRPAGSVPGIRPEGYSSIIFETEKDVRELEGRVLWICRSPFRPEHRRKEKALDRLEHIRPEQGNPVRIYEGMRFKRR